MSQALEKIIEFVQEFQVAYPGMSPTYREICGALGLVSTGSLKYKMDKLVEDGEILQYSEGSVSRGIVFEDTAVITRKQAERMGVDFEKLIQIKEQARISVDRKLSRTSKISNGAQFIRRVYP